MKIAFIGDVVGKSGRKAVAHLLPKLKRTHGIDFTIANLENAAGGFGITPKAFDELERSGVDFYTSGNHIWDKRDGIPLLNSSDKILRPANYPGDAPGRGYRIVTVGDTPVAVFNIQGRVFMPSIDCPFRTIDRCLKEVGDTCRIKIVDVHAEATSEKIAMGWYLDGRVSAVVGTHTHVPTRDAEILPRGTGYVTDVGMTGSHDSVLGVSKEAVLQRFLEMRPVRFEVAKNDIISDIVIIDVNAASGRTTKIKHLRLRMED
jgi:metallophosphoesterase (TIGR00282 family)